MRDWKRATPPIGSADPDLNDLAQLGILVNVAFRTQHDTHH